MPKNVVCKKCNNLVNGWCEKVIDSPDQDMQRDCQYFCEKTNADRIRSMSDEELLELFMFDTPCEIIVNSGNCLGSPCNCRECILGWLRQQAE